MHILPAVRRLEEKYADVMVAVGVHSGKFIAERDTANIQAATRRLGITHPVVNDKHFRVWRSYSVQAWPTVALISPDGKYIGNHAGEITFDMFDPIIEAVAEAYSQAGMIRRGAMHFAPDPTPTSDPSPLLFPGKVLAAPGGRLFIADTAHNRVLVGEEAETENEVTIVAAIGGGDAGLRDGSFSEALLHGPEGMALTDGTLYIADTENHAVRAADLKSGTVRTIAGTGEQGNTRAGGVGTRAKLNSPWDLLVRDGILYIAMAGTHQLWRMDLRSGEVGPFVGSGRENIDDGPNPRATLAQPSGLTTDGKRLFFADSESSALRAADFTPEGFTQTLVGEGLFEFGDRDGRGLQARLQHCLGVGYHAGKVYIADTYNNKIKTYYLESRECAAAYGTGEISALYEPGGLSISANGDAAHLYVADTNSHRVLRFRVDDAGTLSPPTPLTINFAPQAARLPGDKDFIK